jgi:hypothetical protein
MGTPERSLSDGISSHWRRGAEAWPLFIIILGTMLSFGWTVMLLWIALGLIGLAG